MNPIKQFEEERSQRIRDYSDDSSLNTSARTFLTESIRVKYSYNFSWMGRPIIQYPQDIIALQEIIWRIQPDLIIETGIAHGGSLIFFASMLELLGGRGYVLGIDVDIREHNWGEIVRHPLYHRITMIEGSSICDRTAGKVREFSRDCKCVLVCLDSNHTHEHVLRELELYAPLVSKDSYCIVFDTVIEELPGDKFPDRTWSRGDNPATAVQEFLTAHNEFSVDEEIDVKLLVTAARGGYLKKIK